MSSRPILRGAQERAPQDDDFPAETLQISKNFKNDLENVAALQCGIAKLRCEHAILSWRFELG
jgi:hypothetical protein